VVSPAHLAVGVVLLNRFRREKNATTPTAWFPRSELGHLILRACIMQATLTLMPDAAYAPHAKRVIPNKSTLRSEGNMIVQRHHTVQGLFVREAAPQKPQDLTPLVMIPGASHGWWAYEEWLPFFAERGRPSYALSLRNHTDSYSVPEEEYLQLEVHDYVEDVLAVLEWVSRPVVLMGHSMGGLVAQKVAELVDLKGLILVAPVGPGQLGPMNTPVPRNRPVMPDAATVRKLWFHNISDERFAAIYERLCPESPSVVNQYRTGKIPVDRSRIHCPILVIEGEFDRSGVHDTQDVAWFYDATYLLALDAGHDLMLEPGAAEVAATIDKWMRKAKIA
jgi:pimeloyl-ACP methyl ester carboxylesterase